MTEQPEPPEQPAYAEPARSYRSLGYLGLVLLALFGVDVAFGSAVDHLPGWVLAAVLVLGVDALVVHAARVTKSLTLTAEQLQVGEETLPRREILGARVGLDPDLPVLGWPNGMPRGVAGLVVRLTDGQDVVVPTRHPDRLRGALGVGDATGREIRTADDADFAELPDIAERCDTLFRTAGYDLPHIAMNADDARAARAVFVAGRPAIGFVQVDEVDGLAHVAEIGVVPKYMRRGIGSALLERACGWAADAGYPAITLITYADVPWNGPWYARHGFVEIAADTPELRRRRARQTELGLDAVARRIAMRREL